MPSGKDKSRSKRRVFVRTPSGKVTLQYRKRKPSKAKCAECGRVLSAMPNVRAKRLKNIAKTKKRPSRPFGGNLCSICARKKIIERVRSKK